MSSLVVLYSLISGLYSITAPGLELFLFFTINLLYPCLLSTKIFDDLESLL
jgi:hypothetical protein